MRKMGRSSGAIGFAVYPDLLQRLPVSDAERPDVDVLLLYGEDDSPSRIHRVVHRLMEQGVSVRCATDIPEKITFSRKIHVKDWEESEQ
jgi:hypothetical protein